MSYSRIMTNVIPEHTLSADLQLLFNYMTLKIENIPYPKEASVFAVALLLSPVMLCEDNETSIFGLFTSSQQAQQKHRHSKRAFLDVDGVDGKCDTCNYR